MNAKLTTNRGLVTRVNKPLLIALILIHIHALILANNITVNASKLQWMQMPSNKLKRQTQPRKQLN